MVQVPEASSAAEAQIILPGYNWFSMWAFFFLASQFKQSQVSSRGLGKSSNWYNQNVTFPNDYVMTSATRLCWRLYSWEHFQLWLIIMLCLHPWVLFFNNCSDFWECTNLKKMRVFNSFFISKSHLSSNGVAFTQQLLFAWCDLGLVNVHICSSRLSLFY